MLVRSWRSASPPAARGVLTSACSSVRGDLTSACSSARGDSNSHMQGPIRHNRLPMRRQVRVHVEPTTQLLTWKFLSSDRNSTTATPIYKTSFMPIQHYRNPSLPSLPIRPYMSWSKSRLGCCDTDLRVVSCPLFFDEQPLPLDFIPTSSVSRTADVYSAEIACLLCLARSDCGHWVGLFRQTATVTDREQAACDSDPQSQADFK